MTTHVNSDVLQEKDVGCEELYRICKQYVDDAQTGEDLYIASVKIAVRQREHTNTYSKMSKCVRCWNKLRSVGIHKDHPELCSRCVKNVRKGLRDGLWSVADLECSKEEVDIVMWHALNDDLIDVEIDDDYVLL